MSHLTIFFLRTNSWNIFILEESMQLLQCSQIEETFQLLHTPIQLWNAVNSHLSDLCISCRVAFVGVHACL